MTPLHLVGPVKRETRLAGLYQWLGWRCPKSLQYAPDPLAHLATTFYRPRALETLRKTFVFFQYAGHACYFFKGFPWRSQ